MSPGWADTPKPKFTTPTPPTKAQVLAMADGYIAAIVPKLIGDDYQAINALKFDLETTKNQPLFRKQLISDRVSQFAVELAAQKSLQELTVAAAYLVHAAPTNPRTTNLLANIVAVIPKREDTVTLLEYTLQLDSKSISAMLNLASAYLNANKNEKAKTLLDHIVALDANNQRAWRMLACYWYKKGDNRRTLDALMKAAAPNGARLKKSKENDKKTEKDEAAPDDSLDILAQKAEDMKDLVPLSTADVLEPDFPDIAQKIRDHVGKLIDNECVRLPLLPDVKTNDLKDYVTNLPILNAWVDTIAKRAETGIKEAVYLQTGVAPGDSDAVAAQKADTEAEQQIRDALANAQKMIEAMRNLPGVSQDEIDKAERDMVKTAKEHGIHLSTTAKSADDPASPDAAGNGDQGMAPPDLSNVTDTGGIFSQQNYRDFERIRASYERYFLKFFQDYTGKVSAISEAYAKLLKEEKTVDEQMVNEIRSDEDHAREEATRAGAMAFDNSEFELRRKKERLRHIRKCDELGSGFYRQWVNLYMPQYTQKMKPMLEHYWYVSALYVRNMNDPKIMKRSYAEIKQTYWTYVGQAAGHLSDGGMFSYDGSTEEEVQQLEDAIHTAELEAETKKTQYNAEIKSADNLLPKWLEDKLVFSVACEFLAIKITARNIEFEAYIPGLSGKVDYNFHNNVVTTSTALSARINIGVQIGPLEAKIEGEAKMLGSKTSFNLNNGKVTEDSDGFASGTLKGTLGKADKEWNGVSAAGDPDKGGLKARLGATIQIDPALDTEVTGKVYMSAPGVEAMKKF